MCSLTVKIDTFILHTFNAWIMLSKGKLHGKEKMFLFYDLILCGSRVAEVLSWKLRSGSVVTGCLSGSGSVYAMLCSTTSFLTFIAKTHPIIWK